MILGVDPGSRHTGWGVVERQGSRMAVRAQGRISLAPASPLPRRLAELSRSISALVEQHQPQVAVLETLFHGVNPRSLIVLAQARGVILASLCHCGLDVHEYSPAEIKSALTGNGRADKEQVAKMVRLVLGLGTGRLSADASDALAVAICFGQRARIDRLSGRRAESLGTRAETPRRRGGAKRETR